MDPVERRIRALHKLLSLEQSTTKALPFADWLVPPDIVWESSEACTIFTNL
jgi:hypothetical protein